MQAHRSRARGAAVLLTAGLAGLVLLAGGCGSSGDDDTSGVASVGSAAPSAEGDTGGGDATQPDQQEIYDGLLAYAKCMRSKGVTNFPDPVLGKGLQVSGNDVGADTASYKEADAACKSNLPDGGAADDVPADRAAALKYSQCMRDNGVTNFPDPNESGGLDLDIDKIGMAPDNPVFKKAEEACKQYLGSGGTQQNGG